MVCQRKDGVIMDKEEKLFREAALRGGLGDLIARPRRVAGGFLHKMYRIETVSGTYALKLLNPVIMKRADVMENFRRAERLERILQENGIPMIPALERDGEKMHCLEGQYYYLFAWSEGKALGWRGITEEHCRIAGGLLARIHRIPCVEEREVSGCEVREERKGDCREGGMQEGLFDVDWDGYIKEAVAVCPEIGAELAENRALLYQAQGEYNAAIVSAPKVRCICDGDMDCKNVLWKGSQPLLIDLECLDYGNPFTEMFQLALSWAGGAVCELDFGRFRAFVDAYRQEYGVVPVEDWKVLSGVGYSWLDWFAYNVRRGLGMECGDEEERQMGIREVRETVRRIRYYQLVRGELAVVCGWE